MNYLKKTYLFLNEIKLSLYKFKIVQKFVGEFPKKEVYFPEYVKNKSDAKIFFFKNKGFLIKKPNTIEKKTNIQFPSNYVVPDKKVFVGLIKNGRIVSKNANILTEGNIDINEDISKLAESMDSYENYLILPKIKRVNARVLTISNSENYFHWMFEILPRINFINKAKLKTDFYLLPNDKSFQKDSIKALKISKNKIIGLNKKLILVQMKFYFLRCLFIQEIQHMKCANF